MPLRADIFAGFINQFGTIRDAEGNLQVNAQHVGLWAAINFVSQVVFQLISPFSANRFGLKINMYIFTAMITVVSPLLSQDAWNPLTLQATVLEIVATTWYVYLM